MELLVVITSGCGGVAVGRWLRQVYFPTTPSSSHHAFVLDVSLGLSIALVVVRLLESSLPFATWSSESGGISVGKWLSTAMVVQSSIIVPAWWTYSLLESYACCWESRLLCGKCRKGSRLKLPTTTESVETPKQYKVYAIHIALSILIGVLLSFFSIPWIVHALVVVPLHSRTSMSLLDMAFSGLYAIGVIIAATLNGFGSVTLPYTFCIGWWIHPVHPSCLVGAEQELAHTRAMLQQRRQARPQIPVAQQQLPRTFLGLGRVIQQKNDSLRNEVDFLETLIEEQEADLVELRAALQTAQRAQSTPFGRVSLYLGYVFSAVLIYRLGAAVWHVILVAPTNRPQGPPIDMVIAKILVSIVWPHPDNIAPIRIEEATQYTSLLIALALRFSSTRNFLRRAGTIQRHVVLGSGHTNAMLISLATGCYALATTATAPTTFVLRQGIVDMVYVTTAVVTGAVLVVVAHIVRANTLRYQNQVDDDVSKKAWTMGRSGADGLIV